MIRVHLAPIDADDAEELLAAVEESRSSMGFIGWGPFITSIERARQLAELMPELVVVREVDSQRFLGIVALQPFGPGEGRANYAAWIRTSEGGKGYATEASRELFERGFVGGLEEIVAFPSAKNLPSVAIAHRLGMRVVASSPDRIDFSLTRAEWHARKAA